MYPKYPGLSCTLNMEQNITQTEATVSEPDMRWRDVCECGKVHRWGNASGKVKNCVKVVERALCEDGDDYNFDAYYCKKCFRKITPRWNMRQEQLSIAGITRWSGIMEWKLPLTYVGLLAVPPTPDCCEQARLEDYFDGLSGKIWWMELVGGEYDWHGKFVGEGELNVK